MNIQTFGLRAPPVELPCEEVVCVVCKGRGYFWGDHGPSPKRETCDECSGAGWLYEDVEI